MRLVAFFCLCAVANALVEKPSARLRVEALYEEEISWPESYALTYRLSLPYTAGYQNEIKYEVEYTRRQKKSGKTWVKVKSGANTLVYNSEAQTEYIIHPRMNELACDRLVGIAEGIDVEAPLPDLVGWERLGTGWVGDTPATIYEQSLEKGGRRMEYRFYVSTKNSEVRPLRLHMLGREVFSGAHYDEYVVEYLKYSTKKPDKDEFDVPSICEAESDTFSGSGANGGSQRREQLRAMFPKLPRKATETSEDGQGQQLDRALTYEEFQSIHPRRHRSLKEYQERAQLFEKNRAMIEEHNANPHATFKMEINRFADMHIDEIAAILFPPKPPQPSNSGSWGEYEFPHVPLTDPAAVPKSVDWRGTVVGGSVKDQAICGSCWAFGAVGTIESAYNKAHPDTPVKLSEQEVSDCSWEMGSNACAGGEPFEGIAAAAQQGIALAEEYEYQGRDDFCRSDLVPRDKRISIRGYGRVPAHDDSALMEAIYSRGAIAVSIDATLAFAFYKEGVFTDQTCKTQSQQLNHAVLAVGYGTDEGTKEDYWILRNSWSEHWGAKGYIKISRARHACGVTADPVYAIV